MERSLESVGEDIFGVSISEKKGLWHSCKGLKYTEFPDLEGT